MATQRQHVETARGYLSPESQLGLFTLPRRREFLIRHVGAPPKRILDLGSATGYIALLLMRLGHQVTGIELNPRMATEARSRGVKVIEHDLEEPLLLPDGSVDAVHACEILEHLFDTEGLLREVHRVLVPGGVLILSTPNLNSLANRVRVLVGRPLPMWGSFPDDVHGCHVRVFNKAKVTDLLARTGFRPDVITGINQSRLGAPLDRLPTLSELLLIKAVRV